MTRDDVTVWRTSFRLRDVALAAVGGATVVVCAALFVGWTCRTDVAAGALGVLALAGLFTAPSWPAFPRRPVAASAADHARRRARPHCPLPATDSGCNSGRARRYQPGRAQVPGAVLPATTAAPGDVLTATLIDLPVFQPLRTVPRAAGMPAAGVAAGATRGARGGRAPRA